ncbi:SDR family oxidoreductase [Methanobrevibacter sp.]|uniref:SDR family oxidoreductase n=1 Tax=Methanobrevibacter sp. TaxID=66852 RepID=UPI0038905201
MDRLKDKVAIVTGATAGMGRAIAKLFAQEGACVSLIARRENKLQELVDEIEADGGKAIYVVGDVSVQENIDELVKKTVDTFGKIDICVNNAGVPDPLTPVADVDDELWNKVLDVNLTAIMKMMRAVIPEMDKNGGGSLVTVASVGGITGTVAGASYVASKHAAIGLAKNTGFLYQNHNIRSNVIAPGMVNTDMAATVDPAQCHPEGFELISKQMALTPRFGESEEIAQVALFLASDESSIVNGTVIRADCGWRS